MNDAEHARNLYQQAELAYNRGDAALGRKYVAGALNMSHDVPEAWYKLGVEHMQAQRLPQAVAAFRRVIEVIPNSAYALTNLGWTLWQQGRHDEGREVRRMAGAEEVRYRDNTASYDKKPYYHRDGGHSREDRIRQEAVFFTYEESPAHQTIGIEA